ncbi:MAG: type II toxin-antitoxin system death-on-curing family toxin [Peptoniphilaceae bacterium]|nr:type II toxin-antitoxin system death-on-curing family toxin [Peptoniphilaceae bacterium]MDY5842563.1 type II toxin-antitoxin system death-on-curing family toxin [Peptoniphilaceae bacterium]
MKYLSVRQILMLHDALIQTSGGSNGLRDESLLDSAVFAPIQTFDGKDLYPTLIDKASRLAFGLITNHPFIDGNKRIGTHAMLVLLAINGLELEYNDEDLIEVILQVAAGELSEVLLHQWIGEHIK